MEEVKTVAELTIYYKHQRLTSLIFDTQETADTFLEALTSLASGKGKQEIRFSVEVRNVYTDESILQEIDDYRAGNVEPKGTILDMMKVIDGLN